MAPGAFLPSENKVVDEVAALRAQRTMDALDAMCHENHCAQREINQCVTLKAAFDLIEKLVFHSFAVLDITCNLHKAVPQDSALWQQVCTHCTQQRTWARRVRCQLRKGAEGELQALADLGFTVHDMLCLLNEHRHKKELTAAGPLREEYRAAMADLPPD